METKVTNHWGTWVSSDTPVTGVISNHSAEWLHEESWDGIDLAMEQHFKECEICANGDVCDVMDAWEWSDDILIGSWVKDSDGLYEPDETGQYAAIYQIDSNVTQIVWSRYTRRGALCSPCYPGQVDLDTPGDYLGYDLPPDIYGDVT